MTKTEKNQEVTKQFYALIQEAGYQAHDEGHGYWYVEPKGNVDNRNMFMVTRKFDVETVFCENGEVLEFANQLETRLNEYIRMFNL
jgi:hypothetical protein|tara:strand:+ start:122 stop:379 length:258 start_codon:yes stop_codon:yes gene_type:complete